MTRATDAEVRLWAAANGVTVNAQGRVSLEVRAAHDRAARSTSATSARRVVRVGDRRTGASTDAVRWVVQDPEHRVIVVATAAIANVRAREIADHLRDEGQRVRQADVRRCVITAETAARGDALRGRHIEVWIDDLDALLRAAFGPIGVAGVNVLANQHEQHEAPDLYASRKLASSYGLPEPMPQVHSFTYAPEPTR